MWADFKPKALTCAQFVQRLSDLKWTTWKPIGIVLHNTASPTLEQWAESGEKHDNRINNLEAFYEGQGWKGGPHWFVSRNFINEFNNPLRHGTHSPSFNADYFGIEMVGDYDGTDEFDSGDGAKVRDNAVFVMAALCTKFRWDIAKVLKFHKEDLRTNHDCPGPSVHKDDIIARVKRAMEGRDYSMPVPSLPADEKENTNIYATEFGGAGDEQDGAYGVMVDGNQPGVALPWKFRGPRQKVELKFNGRKVIADIVDVGPWNIKDQYWETDARPLAEHQYEEGDVDFKGRHVTSPAGIDLTPRAMDLLGVPGKPGMRSCRIDWQFTDQLTKPPAFAPAKPAFPPAHKPDPEPEEMEQGEEDTDTPTNGDHDAVEVEVVQRRLLALGYKEIGKIDGKFGGRTTGAIAAFKADRDVDPVNGIIDKALRDELAKAEREKWKRPIAKERKEATEEQVEVHAPELENVKTNRFMGFWGAIGAAFTAAVSAIGDNFKEGLTYVTDAKDYLNLVPGWLWLFLLAGVLAFFYLQARRGAAKITDSYRKGERN